MVATSHHNAVHSTRTGGPAAVRKTGTRKGTMMSQSVKPRCPMYANPMWPAQSSTVVNRSSKRPGSTSSASSAECAPASTPAHPQHRGQAKHPLEAPPVPWGQCRGSAVGQASGSCARPTLALSRCLGHCGCSRERGAGRYGLSTHIAARELYSGTYVPYVPAQSPGGGAIGRPPGYL